MKKSVNGHVLPSHHYARTQPQRPILKQHVAVGRNNVDVVRQHVDPIGNLLDRDRRFPRQNFRQDAAMRWIQMLHQHKGHTGFFRQVMEEIGECFQASGRRADANDGKKLRAATLRRRTAS